MWRILSAICGLTFMCGGGNLLIHAWGDCTHVSWQHRGGAHGIFEYTCRDDAAFQRWQFERKCAETPSLSTCQAHAAIQRWQGRGPTGTDESPVLWETTGLTSAMLSLLGGLTITFIALKPPPR